MEDLHVGIPFFPFPPLPSPHALIGTENTTHYLPQLPEFDKGN
jgi:hypothetical protein